MSDQTKLTLASLTVMILPYQIGFALSVLVVTAILCAAIVAAREIWGAYRYPPTSSADLSNCPKELETAFLTRIQTTASRQALIAAMCKCAPL
jgi:hypothetical protein